MKINTTNTYMRNAIAMIELIFALVIMSITLVSIPILTQVSKKSTFVSLQQESIGLASSQMNLILSYVWDEANTNQSHSAILKTTYIHHKNHTLRNFTASKKRAGMTKYSSRLTHYFENPTLTHFASALGSDNGDLDDIDDFHNSTYTLSPYLTSSSVLEGDYIDKNISIHTLVAYGDDVPRTVNGQASKNGYAATILTFSNPFSNTHSIDVTSLSTNIKLINVKLISNSKEASLSKTIQFSAFSCNIGSYVVAKRYYP